ncbi:MBL fold metallo-hydrolase [Allokutzneria sp. A3M-2-11 16]|uniref:MBL fold metallo-hydrolase n=1 Tax=Allokutzneria sp. A3M-2-11 16 TaxID=2962043 RepID=UPI0020B7A817|nr:MBL fold metallo-hydrolase [Allokutzneria sp. A3M-2-11 16]MCP3805355.1 MBL fold metallo-hydrolase [Allokutzneria sp. A3M-2-11 16]
MNTMTFGDVSLTRVMEWHGPIMPPSAFVPESEPQHWTEFAPDHWIAETDQVHCALQTWVLRSGGRTILVDTGVGNHKERPQMAAFHLLNTPFLDNLAAAGVNPEDVDVVINTHIHADHVGWNTRLDGDEWVPTFPNATYLVPQRDFEHFHGNDIFEDSVRPVHDAGLVQLWDESYVIDENLRLDLAAGHTPGSSVLRLDSGGERAVFVGDLLHTVVQLVEPDFNSCFCEDPERARASRRSVLEWAADTNSLVLPAHLAGHGAAEVRRDGSKFAIKEWAPLERISP